ncbi:MAG: hypothetical protein U5Q44_02320 [Dehalococcoidia bacterium]|nr:hypothetical protein [Dehalococcoidia bacterium]
MDLYLRLLREEWERVPGYAAEWATWTEDQRLAFVTEWSVNTDQLGNARMG